MARKRRRRRKQHDHELSHGVIAILLIVFAIISFLAFFDKAGTLGVVIDEWILSFFFGSMRYFVPFVVVILAWYLVTDKQYDYRPTHGIGAVLFFLTTSSLLHLRFPLNDMWAKALEGAGGGVFGMLAWVLKNYLGVVASTVVLVGAMLIAIILVFNTTLASLLDGHRRAMEKMGLVKKQVRRSVRNVVDEEDEEEYDEEEEDEDAWDDEDVEEIGDEDRRFARRKVDDEEEDEEEYDDEEEEGDEEDEDEEGPTRHVISANSKPFWMEHVIVRKPPSVNLLHKRTGKPTSGDIEENSRIIEETFAEFRIDVKMHDIRVGPTVTQYTMKPAKGVKVSRITSLTNDLALALAAHPIRIEAPIPGKSLVGIEVPNSKTAMVSLRELIESKEYKSRKHNMMVGLGKDVGGKVWFADLPRMPHLLIAGSTGSGKTVCMNTIITSLLYQNTAEDLRMIMVDPKRVELTLYNGIPHLLTPVITDTKKTVNALRWTIAEMDRRFDLLSKAGNRDIKSYNKAHPKDKLPYIVFIIDELADLMVTASGDVETGIIRLAQMARAVGIHLIVATQRPSVDVITGLMKANIPGRIAFSVASITDSRTILDSSGAEKLIGKGDMLLATADFSKPVRIQGAFISEEETKDIIDYLRGDDEPVYDESITQKQSGNGTAGMFGAPDDDHDPLFEEAKSAIFDAKKASASFLQRKLKVGYARAARILDELEEAGIVGPSNGSKPREILITEKDLATGAGSSQQFNAYKEVIKPPVEEVEEEEEDEYIPGDEDEEDDILPEDADEDTEAQDEDEEEEWDDEDEEYEDEDDEEEYEEEDDEDDEYEDEEEDDDTEEEEEEDDAFPIRNISP